jgi:hypothetical protein
MSSSVSPDSLQVSFQRYVTFMASDRTKFVDAQLEIAMGLAARMFASTRCLATGSNVRCGSQPAEMEMTVRPVLSICLRAPFSSVPKRRSKRYSLLVQANEIEHGANRLVFVLP